MIVYFGVVSGLKSYDLPINLGTCPILGTSKEAILNVLEITIVKETIKCNLRNLIKVVVLKQNKGDR